MMTDTDIERAIYMAAESLGTPLYLYFPDLIAERIKSVKEATAGMGIRYAVKTNPNPWIIEWLKDHIDSLDVSSSGELNLATKAGWEGEQLEFTGPGKTRTDLQNALNKNVKSIVVEDISEARLLNQICQDAKKKVGILVRIAPKDSEEKFGVRLAGRVTQFGVDEDCLSDFIGSVSDMENIHIRGFHIYSGSQCLDDEAMASHFRNMWKIFKNAIEQLGEPISELVFGAGMGIPYHEGDEQLSLKKLHETSAEILKEIEEINSNIKCFVEVGRYLIGEAGFFVTSAVRVKESLGHKVVICDGGMNHNSGACGHLGGVTHRHYQMYLLKPRSDNQSGNTESENYRIVGPLCTAIDTLARNIKLPAVSEGDLIVVRCAGSYGPTSSPLFFISHDLPHEAVYIADKKQIIDIGWLPKPSQYVL